MGLRPLGTIDLREPLASLTDAWGRPLLAHGDSPAVRSLSVDGAGRLLLATSGGDVAMLVPSSGELSLLLQGHSARRGAAGGVGGQRDPFSAFGAGGFDGGGFENFGAGGQQDIEAQISLEEAYAGTTRELARPGASTLKVKIPAGSTDGTRMRVRAGGQNIVLTIRIAPHPQYTLEGRDVSLELPLAPWEAALGARVQVPTLGGPIDMKIPAGSQSGQRLRLKGRGLPAREAGASSGDQYLRLQLRYPTPLSEAQQALLQQWADSAEDYDPRAR